MKPELSLSYNSNVVNLPPRLTTPNTQLLNWTEYTLDDFIHYEVMQGSTASFTYEEGTLLTTITDRTITIYTVEGLNAATDYYYKIFIKKISGEYTDWEDISSAAPTKAPIGMFNDNGKLITYHGSETWEYEGSWNEKTLSGSPLKEVIGDTDVVPTMTSNTTPEGEVSTSSEQSGYEGYNAFDGDTTNTGDGWVTPAGTTSGWLQYKFTSPKAIGKYKIMSQVSDNVAIDRCPKDWTFEGSNDGASWDVLDTRTGITNWVQNEFSEFIFDNTTEYQYYRINVTANNGASYLAIGELELIGYDSLPLQTPISNNTLFGGHYGDNVPVQETWELRTDSWVKLSLAIEPSARLGHGFAGGILFGGEDTNGNLLNDTWEWSGSSWSKKDLATKPPARKDFGMTVTDDGTVYIYGGEGENGLLNDFWKYDGSWVEVTPSNFPDPLPPLDSTSPDGTVSSDSVLQDRVPEQAFDNNNTGYSTDAWCSETTGGPWWITYDYGEGNEIEIISYSIHCTSRVMLPPLSWELQGSNNNADWDILHSVSGLSEVDWSPYEEKNYDVSTPGSYRYYRLYITNAGGSNVEIGEIEYFAKNGLKRSSLTPDLKVIGGTDGTNYSNKVYSYDAETNSFTEETFTTNPDARAGALVEVLDNDIILYGGYNSIELSDMWRLNRAADVLDPSNENLSPTTAAGYRLLQYQDYENEGNYDNYINATAFDTYYQHTDLIKISDEDRALYQLDISEIEDKTTIDSATLRVNVESVSAATTVEIYPITSFWYPTVTWDSQPSIAASPIGTFNIDATGEMDIDITGVVKEWVSGSRGNYGFMLKKADETDGAAIDITSMDADINKPKLNVKFLMEGLGFDDAATDYDFYTTPEGIKIRQLEAGSILGGRTVYQDLELINANNLPASDVTVDLSNVHADDTVQISEEGTFSALTLPFNLGTLAPGEKKVLRIKIQPGPLSRGERNPKLNVTATVTG